MSQIAVRYLIPVGTLVFFSLIGDWFGTQYFKTLADPNLPLLVTRSIGGLAGLAFGFSYILKRG